MSFESESLLEGEAIPPDGGRAVLIEDRTVKYPRFENSTSSTMRGASHRKMIAAQRGARKPTGWQLGHLNPHGRSSRYASACRVACAREDLVIKPHCFARGWRGRSGVCSFIIAVIRHDWGEHDGNYAEFHFFAGASPSETIAAQWKNFDEKRGTLRISEARVMGQSKKPRDIYRARH